ncbi:hypothetical protein ACWEJ6_50495 [Nonomuraea sp. NPDC004702]
MYAALALYGGFLRVTRMDLSTPTRSASVHAAWEGRHHEEIEIRRAVTASGPDGISTTKTGDPAHPWPALAPRIAAELGKTRTRSAH